MATLRQKNAVKKIVENRGISVSKAMREAGYSAASAKNPKNLTDSKAWPELMDTALPDSKLLTVHKKLLNHKEWRANDAGLDKAYKLKGKYAAQKVKIDDIDEIPEEELDERLAETEEIAARYRKYALPLLRAREQNQNRALCK
ncbi:MAG: hypothetical protein PHY34_03560 [Patescibacteria group bacterium]|nr:hypothetical protein [Patescibacteria group bacterium]MDD5715640.1 hypothetical protein [Patescibacteria group bacterium]